VLLTAIVQAGILSADDLPEIGARGVLRVAIDPQLRPEVFTFQSGEASGFEGEMVQAFAGLHRLKVEIVNVPDVAGRFTALLAGKADLVIAIAATEPRRKQVSFTTEVFPGGVVLVTRPPHPAITALDQLRGKRVGVFKGSNGADVAAAALPPEAKLDDSFMSNDAVLLALRTGEVDAMAAGLGGSFLNKRKDPSLEVGLVLAPSPGPGWATRKDAPQLFKAAEEFLFNLRQTPTWNRLVIKYYGEVALEALRKARVPH
jgi:polar amino acid transport system substrate-binding protein